MDRARQRELQWEIENFNCEYAAVLDRGEIGLWPSFFTEDAVYRVTARENVDAAMPLDLVSCEGMGMLLDRAYAVAHTEMYAPRYLLHQISNTRVLSFDEATATAEANYVLYETVIDEPTRLIQVGKYRDRFSCTGVKLLLKERQCIYDTVLVPNCLVYPA